MSFVTFGLSIDVDREGPTCNPAVRLLGHIALDMARPRAALEAYHEALEARLKLVEPDDPAIADVYDSIACSYTEMDNVMKAFEYLDKAKKIHHARNPNNMARTYAIFAMTFLRAGKFDEALVSLKDCWRLQNLSEEEIVLSQYPKHSGDIVLLSRIQYAQGKVESALQLASKSINIRRGILGNKGPRVADSMYLVATMLRSSGKEALALKLLREIVDMGQGLEEMRGHVARALWMLGKVEREIGDPSTADELTRRAREVRESIKGREAADEDTDEGFSRLVGYMLW
jgi:tetratricopeptide (TPR) repeat protein